jgi:hypothetical protein
MRDLKKQERTAIEAVARRFSATWERGSDPPDAYIMVAGKRVAVDITTLEAYRYIYSQLRMATDLKKILMVFGDGRVGMLTG